jgi:hypothetical protein
MSKLISDRLVLPDSPEEIFQEYSKRGWTDGLPIIPPTEESVERMVAFTGRDTQEVIACLPPTWGAATVEFIAINAVMAGCIPEYMPVIITAIQAMAEEKFNLLFVQATTHPCAPLVIVNGPITKKLLINSGSGAFGSYYRANGTIGRAIRLILLNIGGAIPGETDMATQGQPSQFSFCIAENEEKNPWSPLHVEMGFQTSDSTVTVVAAENPHNINDHSSTSAEGLLYTISGSVTSTGSNNIQGQGGNPIIALCPEHAATFARDGYSKDEIKDAVFKNARIPVGKFAEGIRKRFYNNVSLDETVSIVKDKKDLIIIVVGGPGKHSSYLPTSSGNWAVTKLISC